MLHTFGSSLRAFIARIFRLVSIGNMKGGLRWVRHEESCTFKVNALIDRLTVSYIREYHSGFYLPAPPIYTLHYILKEHVEYFQQSKHYACCLCYVQNNQLVPIRTPFKYLPFQQIC